MPSPSGMPITPMTFSIEAIGVWMDLQRVLTGRAPA